MYKSRQLPRHLATDVDMKQCMSHTIKKKLVTVVVYDVRGRGPLALTLAYQPLKD